MLMRKLLCRALFCICIVGLAVVSFHSAYATDRPDHKNALAQIRNLIGGDDRYFYITKPNYVNGFQRDTNDYIVFTTYTIVFKVSSKEHKEGFEGFGYNKSKSLNENLMNELPMEKAVG